MGYRKANEISWIYSLPGGLFHDFLTHPLYLMLEYTGRPLKIQTMARSYGTLIQGLSDELHIMVDGENAVGKLTISFNSRPYQHFLKIYHKKAIITVDFNNMTMIANRYAGLPGAVTKIVSNFGAAKGADHPDRVQRVPVRDRQVETVFRHEKMYSRFLRFNSSSLRNLPSAGRTPSRYLR